MQFSVENTSQLGRKLIITLPTENIESEVDKRLKKIAASANIKGFRPGKAPFSMIVKNYKTAVQFEVIDENMRKSLSDVINKEKLAVASTPHVDIIEGTPVAGEIAQGPIKFEATFEVFPEVDLKGLDGVEIEKVVADITDTDVNETLDAIREQHKEWVTVDRAAQEKDKVIIDFEGKFPDGELLPNGAAQKAPLILGQKQFINGFEEGLVGAKPGSDVTLNLSFPEDYHHKEIAGKAVNFAVKVHEVHEPKLPEINEDFLKKFEIKDNSVDNLTTEIRTNLEREAERKLKNDLKKQVFDKLVELNQIEIPEAAIKAEREHLQKKAVADMKNMYKNAAIPALPEEIFDEQARYRVRLSILLQEAVKLHKLEADESRVWALIEQMAAAYSNPSQAAAWLYGDKNRLQEIEAMVMEDQIVDKLLETAKIQDKKLSYKEIMKRKD